MNINHIVNIGSIVLVLFASSCSKNLYFESVTTDAQCTEKGGYWFNDKCWENYEDDGISLAKIDSTVATEFIGTE